MGNSSETEWRITDGIRNRLLWTDYYNGSHWYLKENQDWEVSHIYNRNREQVLFGFNQQVKDWFGNMKITEDNVNELTNISISMNKEAQFPIDLFNRVVKEFDGIPPLAIEAVPDGTVVPKGTPFAQISNTVEGFGELVTWWEPVLLKSFFPSGCLTRGAWMKIYSDREKLPANRFHSFGFRGYPSKEDAYWGGKAFNIFLKGTDDLVSVSWTPNSGSSSIAAQAHKVIVQFPDEMTAYKYGIDAAKAHGQSVLAIVIDTYDAWRFINKYMVEVVNYAKERGIHVVLRPDSGDTTEQLLRMWEIKERYGLTNVSTILGEGMSFAKTQILDDVLRNRGVPLPWVFIGIGAGFFDGITRDYLGYSMKTAYSNGGNRMKFANDPIKQSIPGIVDLLCETNGDIYVTLRDEGEPFTKSSFANSSFITYPKKDTLFKVVWYSGPAGTPLRSIPRQSWDEISAIAHAQLTRLGKQTSVKLDQSVLSEIKRLRQQFGLSETTTESAYSIRIPDNV